MKMIITMMAIFLIAGCSAVQFDVHMLTLDELRSPENCGQSVIQNYGCWRPISPAGGCKIMVERPRHTGDTTRLTTLGKEVWKCLTGNKEY